MTKLLTIFVLSSVAVVSLAAVLLVLYRLAREFSRRRSERWAEHLVALLAAFSVGEPGRKVWNPLLVSARSRPVAFLRTLLHYLDNCSLQGVLAGERWKALLQKSGIFAFLEDCLRSREAWRVVFGLNCGLRLGLDTMLAPARELLNHSDQLVRFTAAEYLLARQDFSSCRAVLQLLSQAEDWYLSRYYPYFASHPEQAGQLLELVGQMDSASDLVLHKVLRRMPCLEVDEYFKQRIALGPDLEREIAAEYLFEYDPVYLAEHAFHLDIRPYIRALALQACGRIPYRQDLLDRLLLHSGDNFEVIRRSVQASLEQIARRSRAAVVYLRRVMEEGGQVDQLAAIARLFEQIDYTYECLRELDIPSLQDGAVLVLERMAAAGELVDMLTYLRNQNRGKARQQVLSLIMRFAPQAAISQHRDLLERLPEELRQPLLQLVPQTAPVMAHQERRNWAQTGLLSAILLLVTGGPLAAYAAWHWDLVSHQDWQLFLVNLVLDFNRLIVLYVASINSLYLLLMVLSLLGIGWYLRRKRAWTLGDYFRRRLVPPVSIIAPCYDESPTIIESINSLLNIQHPHFEVVVVNDGSRDDTLGKLVNYYGLEKTTIVYRQLLPTAAVRSTYVSSRFPNLFVIDKANGGKADALNAGINLARYPYFCSIDADTLIDGDSLIHAAAPFAFEHTTCVATGCNIRVINGCQVDNGQVEQRRLPAKLIERIQVLEYTRAFIARRTGWSYANGLLIISGAFGLFKKKIALALGGYSTNRSRSHGTVGEDMELVVEYHRHLAEQQVDYQIIFCPDASGWTQVPDRYSVLRRQRERWHRGLIEVLLGNLRLLFNPRYRGVGLFAYPYFFCFEFLGSIIEAYGYLSVVLAAVLGLLNPVVAALLFVFSVMFGTLLSLFGLFLEERHRSLYSLRELLVLVGCCLIENLGYRQITALWRWWATLNLILRQSTWGQMDRRQFTGKPGSLSSEQQPVVQRSL